MLTIGVMQFESIFGRMTLFPRTSTLFINAVIPEAPSESPDFGCIYHNAESVICLKKYSRTWFYLD